MAFVAAAAIALIAALALLGGLLLSLARSYSDPPPPHKHGASAMFVLGSGGHTTELLAVLGSLDFALYPVRTYVAFSGDALSLDRAMKLERAAPPTGAVRAFTLPRARNVGQPYLSSVLTTAVCGACSFLAMLKTRPDILVCNGPGSCVPLCLAALILRAARIKVTRLVYIESVARVSSLSLSGRLLVFVVDRFVVQWPELKEKYPEADYFGLLA